MASPVLGRPTLFALDLVEVLLDQLVEGKSLRAICAAPDMPTKTTILRWLADPSKADFRAQYQVARSLQAEGVMDEILEIADDGSNDWMERRSRDGTIMGWVENGEAIRRSDLRIKARLAFAARMAPKRYGPNADSPGSEDRPLQHIHTIVLRGVRPDRRQLRRIVVGDVDEQVRIGVAHQPDLGRRPRPQAALGQFGVGVSVASVGIDRAQGGLAGSEVVGVGHDQPVQVAAR